ncbi:MAG: tyrosine-type recombinase/integrase [Lachnospiraceae bacterium]|nr:tyrosine-type recombinase/integrase [Lachnospiraceae bacterium]
MNQKATNAEFLQLIENARAHMESNNFTYTTVANCMKTWRSVYNFALSQGISNYSSELAEKYMLEKYGMSIGEDAVTNTQLSPYMRNKVRALRALTEYQLHGHVIKERRCEFPTWPEEYEDMCRQCLSYIKSLGYCDATFRQKELHLHRFVDYMHSQGVSPKEMGAEHLYGYSKTLYAYSKAYLSANRSTLLLCLKFFYENEFIPNDIAMFLPQIHYHAKAKIEKVWTEEEIEQMLNSIDRANPVGKRDYALMAIAANLGLRTCDILNLSIENFDWDKSCINIVQKKTGEPLTLPLSEQIGKAVIDYWMNGRPNTTAKELFVQHTLPYQAITDSMVYHIFNKCYKNSGFKLSESKQRGLHSFRHSLASRLLENDTPINVIGNILGHVNSNSTSAYLRIDIEKLRDCSLEVPAYD